MRSKERALEELVFGWRTAVLLVVAVHLAVCVVFVLRRSVDPLANRLLAALLLVIIGMMTPQMLGFAGFYDAFPWLTFWPFANPLAAGPLVYAYVLALTEKRLPRHFALLLAPAILEFVYSLYWCFRPVADRWAFTDAVHGPWIVPVLNMLQLLLTCGGLLAALHQYLRYRRWLPEHSSATADFDPRWVPASLAILAAPALVSGAYDVADLLFGPFNYFERFPLFLVLAAGAYALSLGALLQPRVAFPNAAAAVTAGAAEPEPALDWSAEADRIRTALQAGGWHLEPRLSLGEFAQRLGRSESHLSRAINQGAGVNFNRFVNEVRVEAAKDRLASGAEDVLAAALDCGFNSKATFNRVFREIVGMTPSAFRRSAITSA